MKIEAEVEIATPTVDVWNIVSNIEALAEIVQAIDEIEVLDRPVDTPMVGLRFRETRTMFGKSATEIMTVTDVENEVSYTTTAASHGATYTTKYSVAGEGSGSVLRVDFESQPMSMLARIMAATLGLLFKNATRKAFAKDLSDIRAAAESR